jgi:hypothetical protein
MQSKPRQGLYLRLFIWGSGIGDYVTTHVVRLKLFRLKAEGTEKRDLRLLVEEWEVLYPAGLQNELYFCCSQ